MYSFRIQVKTDEQNHTKVLRVQGDIVGRDSDRFRTKLDELTQSPEKVVRIDLREVGYIDSHGLGSLVFKHLWLRNNERSMEITVDASTHVADIFKKTELDKALQIHWE